MTQRDKIKSFFNWKNKKRRRTSSNSESVGDAAGDLLLTAAMIIPDDAPKNIEGAGDVIGETGKFVTGGAFGGELTTGESIGDSIGDALSGVGEAAGEVLKGAGEVIGSILE